MEHLGIVLADDHTLFRKGLRRVLEEQAGWQVVAEASDGAEAVRLTLEHKPQIVILDIAMPRLNGVEATRQIARRLPGTRVLVVSMYSDDVYITQALQAGAQGFILKDSADADLVRAGDRSGRG
jgi:DNA-binding NarL/FixJ family response regulator